MAVFVLRVLIAAGTADDSLKIQGRQQAVSQSALHVFWLFYFSVFIFKTTKNFES